MTGYFGIAFALAALACFGISDLVTKISLGTASKWKLLVWGQLFGAAILLALTIWQGQLPVGEITLFAIAVLIATGILNCIGMGFFYKAIETKGVILASTVANAWPIVTVILGLALYGEQIGLLRGAGIAASMLGVASISSNFLHKGEKLRFDESFASSIAALLALGLLFFLVKAPSLAFGAVFTATAMKAISGTAALPFALHKKHDLLGTPTGTLALFAAVGLLDGLGTVAYCLAATVEPVSAVAPITAAFPALTFVLGTMLLHEKPTLRQKAGIAATLVGIIVVSL